MLTRFSYCVIVSRPRRDTQRAASPSSNADAVAAGLLNMVHTYAGPRQTIVQGFDLRNEQHRAHVLRFLDASSLSSTPMFFCSNLQQFTAPGLVSLQMLLDVVSQIVPSPQPVDEGIRVMTEFPQRHELNFTDIWADVLESAESPESKLRMSSSVANRAGQFVPQHRTPVSSEDILRNQAALRSGAGPGGRAVLAENLVRVDHGAGAGAGADNGPGEHERAARSMRLRETPLGLTQTETSYMTGMQEYADVSVFSKMRDEIQEQPRDRPSSSSVPNSIESRMFSKIPNIRNVSEGKQLVERDLMKGFSTEPADLDHQIKAARYERAQLTKQWRARS